MIYTNLLTAKTKIPSVVVDPKGEQDLDVWYTKHAITPEVMDRTAALPEDMSRQDDIRHALISYGMSWNLRDVVPAEEGKPKVTIETESGETFEILADESGKPVTVPVPATFEGMANRSFALLWTVYLAIREDARPKETESTNSSSTSSFTEGSSEPSAPVGTPTNS